MNGSFEAVRVSEHVYWVGAIDWDIRDFHGYSTWRGSTYNAYLIVADEVILIDTVKAPFKDELLSRVASVTDPKNIRYIVSNHSEMDHSSALPGVIAEVEPEKVFASTLGVKDLTEQLKVGHEIEIVKDGDTLNLGGLDLVFWETRMLHWPDSMMTYLPADKLLFSQDGFGMHLATSERFADELPERLALEEGQKYYANILWPYSALILKLLDRVAEAGLEIEILCPDHGPIWRGQHIDTLTGWYRKWATQKPELKAVIVYDTMWGSTEKMALAIEQSLSDAGIDVQVMSLKVNDRSAVVTEVLDAGALLVGSPTINNQIFPSLADFLIYLMGLKPKNLIGAVFGSYGWSGEATKNLAAYVDNIKIEQVGEPVRSLFVPDDEVIAQCRELGDKVAARLKEVVEGGA